MEQSNQNIPQSKQNISQEPKPDELLSDTICYEKPFESAIIANFFIEKALRRFFSKVDSNDIDQKIGLYSVNCAIGTSKDVVSAENINLDCGELPFREDLKNHNWEVSTEPVF